MSVKQIGECQVCGGDFKLRAGRMVHHGYERPGIGYDVGDCLGVGEVPYEVSCELVKRRKEGIESYRAQKRLRLVLLERDEVDQILRTEYRPHPRKRPGEIGAVPTSRPREFLVTYARSAAPDYAWRALIDDEIAKVEHEIEAATRDIALEQRRIEEWRPRPIRTVEEAPSKPAPTRSRLAVTPKQKAAAARKLLQDRLIFASKLSKALKKLDPADVAAEARAELREALVSPLFEGDEEKLLKATVEIYELRMQLLRAGVLGAEGDPDSDERFFLRL